MSLIFFNDWIIIDFLLFTGAGESGKSTIVKQMKWVFNEPKKTVRSPSNVLPSFLKDYSREWVHCGGLQTVSSGGLQQHHPIPGGHPASHAQLGHRLYRWGQGRRRQNGDGRRFSHGRYRTLFRRAFRWHETTLGGQRRSRMLFALQWIPAEWFCQIVSQIFHFYFQDKKGSIFGLFFQASWMISTVSAAKSTNLRNRTFYGLEWRPLVSWKFISHSRTWISSKIYDKVLSTTLLVCQNRDSFRLQAKKEG